MATKKQKIRVGIFLFTCFSLITLSVALISGLYGSSGNEYWMEFDKSILGLGEGGLVEYLGVPVGKVSSIYVTSTNKAHVDILLDPAKVTLRKGVEAQLVLYSFAAGTMAISLSGGDVNAPIIPPGSEIHANPSAFATISSAMSGFIDSFQTILDKINVGMEGMEKGDISVIVNQVHDLLDQGRIFVDDTNVLVREATDTITSLRDDAKSALEHFDELGGDVEGMSGDIGKLIKTTQGKIEQVNVVETQEHLNQLLENLSELTKKLDATAEEVNNLSANAMHKVDTLEYELRGLSKGMVETFDSATALANDLKKDPSSVFRGKPIIKDNQP